MTNDIVTSSGYKMFFRDDSSFEERFKEIRRLAEPLVVKEVIPVIQPLIQPVIITESHIIQEKPDFQKVVAKTIEYKKENIGFKVGIKELVQMLGGILQAHVGIPNLPLLQEIQAVVNYESMSKNNEEVFCNSTANNEYFIFVILTDNSQVKKGNFLQMINGEKCNMNIKCKYWVFKTGNKASIDECKKMMLATANNELLSLSNNLNHYYEHNKTIF
jgi:hypothetical protein